ncbi:hypothetical protein, partial [Saccharothrix sp. Mg75]|uniref:hypothetical protein n=1 Tax=Saccharothrix sp. Mg75 TaxID=3445357 RepID=UPI003EE85684
PVPVDPGDPDRAAPSWGAVPTFPSAETGVSGAGAVAAEAVAAAPAVSAAAKQSDNSAGRVRLVIELPLRGSRR